VRPLRNVVGVRFRKAGKVYYFDPGEWALGAGDAVIVETARGLELGHVSTAPREVEDAQIVQPLKQVVRKATSRDEAQVLENKRKERESLAVCEKKIAEHGLDMQVVDVEHTFDGSKIVFYFTAEGRVDFRELVRDLASTLRTRIELRQIGVRDEAKLLGGLGPCGRILCCCTFLNEFEPVSIRMAKQQNLSLNPSKISGLCGRLMCCLRFECDSYGGVPKPALPAVGTHVSTPDGPGEVVEHAGKALRVSVGGQVREFAADEVEVTDDAGSGRAPAAGPAGGDGADGEGGAGAAGATGAAGAAGAGNPVPGRDPGR